jgi:hypothetical protein
MNLIDFPIERINRFLETHTFTIEDPFSFDMPEMTLDVKIKLTGMKKYISVGEWTEYIQYEMYIISGSEIGVKVFDIMWGKSNENVYYPTTSDTKYYRLNRLVSDTLRNTLKYFGLDYPVISVKIVNKLN